MATQEVSSDWKGHGFTLLIFGVLVVVCSFFFVLGMIVGRSRSPEAVAAPSVPDEVRNEEAPEEELELSFFEAVEEETPPPPPETPAEETAPSPPRRVVVPVPEPPPPPQAVPSPVVPATDAVVLQVAALRSEEQAERLLAELLELGLSAFIRSPDPDAASQFHRVQVGPLDQGEEENRVRALLEAEGYEAIVAN